MTSATEEYLQIRSKREDGPHWQLHQARVLQINYHIEVFDLSRYETVFEHKVNQVVDHGP